MILSIKGKPSPDEFLVEKKNPLVLPPNFDELPEPGKTQSSEVNKNDSFEDKILSGESKNEIRSRLVSFIRPFRQWLKTLDLQLYQPIKLPTVCLSFFRHLKQQP